MTQTEKFRKLINPKTDSYYKLKQYVLGYEICWHYSNYSTPRNKKSDNIIKQYRDGKIYEFIDDEYQNISFFGHVVLKRPYEIDYNQNECNLPNDNDEMFPAIVSKSYELYVKPFLKDLIISNYESKLFQCKIPLRINFNLSFPCGDKPSMPHVDHNFPHNNMLIYFTDTGGDTIIGGDRFTPEEDDIIVFNSDWLHCFKPPKNGRRIVMVTTFI
jgi:hypothetical protein|tara:strand:+ start:742 stop:1386 length:645 start_codon:yes stop_codon:yes gene_type:complete